MGDHDVPFVGNNLSKKNIAILISGGIAAIKAPSIVRSIRRFGANVTAFVSEEALNYTTVRSLEWATTNRVVTKLTSESEHLHKNQPFDAYLIAPATYNTINKFAGGIADGVLTATLAAALGLTEKRRAKIICIPTMHGDMHNSILTENIEKLQKKGVRFMQPRDAYGKHNIPSSSDIAHFLCRELSDSPLKGIPILVTAGPTPVELDKVRIISNVFKGTLGIKIAEQLWLKGAQVQLILGRGLVQTNMSLPTIRIRTFDEYRKAVLDILSSSPFTYGVFCAAVADYRPIQSFEGKIPSKKERLTIDLVPTTKIIDEVQVRFPQCNIISFKLEVGASIDELRRISKDRISRGHLAVVANEFSHTQGDKHIAYLFSEVDDEKVVSGKKEIAEAVMELIEDHLRKPS